MGNAYPPYLRCKRPISVDWALVKRIVPWLSRLGEARGLSAAERAGFSRGLAPRSFFSHRVDVMRMSAAPRSAPSTPHRRPGFTLIEAMAAITIAAIAGSALLLGTSSSIETTDDAMRQTIAYGMAQQLMDEIVGCKYAAIGSTSGTTSGSRQSFDEVADFNGYRSQPPTAPYGIALGTENGQGGSRNATFQASAAYLQYWRQEVDVYYANESNLATKLSTGTTGDNVVQVVEVRIMYNDPKYGAVPLAQIRRVVTYAPPLQVK